MWGGGGGWWSKGGAGGLENREELIASLGLLSTIFHMDHKLLHIATFSGQEGTPRAIPFFVGS